MLRQRKDGLLGQLRLNGRHIGGKLVGCGVNTSYSECLHCIDSVLVSDFQFKNYAKVLLLNGTANKNVNIFFTFVCLVNKKDVHLHINKPLTRLQQGVEMDINLKVRTKMIKPSEQTTQQIERFLKKIAQKFPNNDEVSALTDIHVRVSQDSGEMLAFDDDDNEITRCVVEQWIGNNDEDFYGSVERILNNCMNASAKTLENLGILKPYSFVLENDEKENIAELFIADDDTVIIGKDLMEGLDKDLDSFLNDLLKEN